MDERCALCAAASIDDGNVMWVDSVAFAETHVAGTSVCLRHVPAALRLQVPSLPGMASSSYAHLLLPPAEPVGGPAPV